MKYSGAANRIHLARLEPGLGPDEPGRKVSIVPFSRTFAVTYRHGKHTTTQKDAEFIVLSDADQNFIVKAKAVKFDNDLDLMAVEDVFCTAAGPTEKPSYVPAAGGRAEIVPVLAILGFLAVSPSAL